MKENVIFGLSLGAFILSIGAVFSAVVITPSVTIDENRLLDNSVTGVKIANRTITDDDITDAGISKIADDVIVRGTMTVGTIETGVFTMFDGAVDGYVLTADAFGVGMWKPPSEGGTGIDGEGIKNYIPKFIDGNTLINSVIYEMKDNVGIGTTNPNETLQVAGNISVSSNRIKSYHGFPGPDYDSGWVELEPGCTIFYHSLGGNVDNYVVDIQRKDDSGISNMLIGGDVRYEPQYQQSYHYGFYYSDLTTSRIDICNFMDYAPQVLRVRIWVYS